MDIFAVSAEMVCNLPDALGKHRNLQFCGASVRLMCTVFLDNPLFDVRFQHYLLLTLPFLSYFAFLNFS